MQQKKCFYVDPNLKGGDEVLFEEETVIAVCKVKGKKKGWFKLSYDLVSIRIDYCNGKTLFLGNLFTVSVFRWRTKRSTFGLRIA